MRTLLTALLLSSAVHASPVGNAVVLADPAASKKLAGLLHGSPSGYLPAGVVVSEKGGKVTLTLAVPEKGWKVPAGFPKFAPRGVEVKLSKADSNAVVHALDDKWKFEPSDAAIAYLAGGNNTGATLLCVQTDQVKASQTKQADCRLGMLPVAK